MKFLTKSIIVLLSFVVLNGCGSSASSTSDTSSTSTATSQSTDTDSSASYKGLVFFYPNMPISDYKLTPLSDDEFNALSKTNKLQVADKLLSTLFFGYPHSLLQDKIDSNRFISDIQDNLKNDTTDIEWLENYILDDEIFTQYSIYYQPQAIQILTRFYAMKDLDRYFLHNWIAYILTQTIMFSPAYELSTTHTPDIANVYNRLVYMLNEGYGLRFITYTHMMSEENWRRFRSPEDNGREMLEIFTLDTNDSKVPIAAKALQNWKLNSDNDTLEISLNVNTKPLHLFGTTIYSGEDFYREMVKSDNFIYGVTHRLVDFFFTDYTVEQKDKICNTIISSNPETWQDILLQIVFSKEYLLHNHRTKSAEEFFYGTAKKIYFRHNKYTFNNFKRKLENMHQATMKYKLGKLTRVPKDTLSFAYYSQFVRDYVLLRHSQKQYIDNYEAYGRVGWSNDFIDSSNFDANSSDDVATLYSLTNYLFETIVSRDATKDELELFKNHIITDKDGEEVFKNEFNMFKTNDDWDEEETRQNQEYRKRRIVFIILDYLSRLDATYNFEEIR